jgi:ribosomal protein S16
MKNTILALSVLATATAAGCGSGFVGQREPLGPVGFETAFDQAKQVLEAKKFTIVRSQPETGTIVAKGDIQETQTRLVSTSPTRETATVRIQRSGGEQVVAYVSVVMEEKVNVPTSLLPGAGTYSGAPNDTPIDQGAALSREQAEEWRPAGADHSMEQRILSALRQACRAK